MQTSPTHTYEFGQLVLIQCEDSAAGQQCRRYSGCWAIVHHVYGTAQVVAVGGEMVRYLFCDLQPIEHVSPVLKQVCDTYGFASLTRHAFVASATPASSGAAFTGNVLPAAVGV